MALPLQVELKMESQTLVDKFTINMDGNTLIKNLISNILLNLQLPLFIPESKGKVKIFNWNSINIEDIWNTNETIKHEIGSQINLIVIEIELKIAVSAQNEDNQPTLMQNLFNPEMMLLLNAMTAANGIIDAAANETAARNPRKHVHFDPQEEVPKLENWFKQNQSSRFCLCQNYADILNEKRSDDQKLTVENIRVWFKNRRCAERHRIAAMNLSKIQ